MKCRLHRRRHRTQPGTEHAKAEAAQRELERVRRQWPAVLMAVAEVTRHHERNGIAESINTIFRGGRA